MDTEDEKNKFGFELLHDFFSKLPEDKSLGTDKQGNHTVDLSWIFTEDIPREIIQKTISRLMQSYNNRYAEKCSFKGRTPMDIHKISIQPHADNISLLFTGADDWSKLRISSKLPENQKFSIPTIDVQQFEKEICKTIIEDPSPDYTPFLKGIDTNLNNACNNLVSYYKYLIEAKKEHTTYSCLITPSDSTSTTKRGTSHNRAGNHSTYDRKNEIIPFYLRTGILDDHKPICMIKVSEQKENGDILPNSYITYVYNDLLKSIPDKKNNGYLFVSEPLNGERATRVYYVSQTEFNNLPEKGSALKYESIVKQKLEMNQEDFLQEGNTQISHTNLDSYTDRINFYIDGEKGKSLADYKAYQARIQKLYRDNSIKLPYYKPRITSNDIATIGMQSITGKIDRSAQIALNRSLNHSSQSMDISE